MKQNADWDRPPPVRRTGGFVSRFIVFSGRVVCFSGFSRRHPPKKGGLCYERHVGGWRSRGWRFVSEEGKRKVSPQVQEWPLLGSLLFPTHAHPPAETPRTLPPAHPKPFRSNAKRVCDMKRVERQPSVEPGIPLLSPHEQPERRHKLRSSLKSLSPSGFGLRLEW